MAIPGFQDLQGQLLQQYLKGPTGQPQGGYVSTSAENPIYMAPQQPALPANLYEKGLNQVNAPSDYSASLGYEYPGGGGVMPKYGGGTMIGPGGEQTKNWDVNPLWKPEYDQWFQGQQGAEMATPYSPGSPATNQYQMGASPIDQFAAAPGQILHDSLGNPIGGGGGETPEYPYYGQGGEPYTGTGNSYWFNEADGIWYMGEPGGKITPLGSESPFGGGEKTDTTREDFVNQPEEPQQPGEPNPWEGSPTSPEGYTYYDASGNPYSGGGESYWYNEADKTWYKGTADGKITAIGNKSPWGQEGSPKPQEPEEPTSYSGIEHVGPTGENEYEDWFKKELQRQLSGEGAEELAQTQGSRLKEALGSSADNQYQEMADRLASAGITGGQAQARLGSLDRANALGLSQGLSGIREAGLEKGFQQQQAGFGALLQRTLAGDETALAERMQDIQQRGQDIALREQNIQQDIESGKLDLQTGQLELDRIGQEKSAWLSERQQTLSGVITLLGMMLQAGTGDRQLILQLLNSLGADTGE